jgi:hypothetical protein
MALLMDFHDDLKLPPEATDQIGVRRAELYRNARGQVYGSTLPVIFYLTSLPDHAVEITCAPVPAPGSLSLDCHRVPMRRSQQAQPGRRP